MAETALPTWAELTDLDKGAALMHLYARDSEGPEYATENYPVRYFDHPALLVLDERPACRHAVSVEDDAEKAGALRGAEFQRLYELADAARSAARRTAALGEAASDGN